MTDISEIQVHIEQIIDLLNKVKNDNEEQREILSNRDETIRSLEYDLSEAKDELEGFTEVEISGMGTIQYRFLGKTSLNLINAFHDFLKDQVAVYTGNRPESL